jgi:hypothetical protein
MRFIVCDPFLPSLAREFSSLASSLVHPNCREFDLRPVPGLLDLYRGYFGCTGATWGVPGLLFSLGVPGLVFSSSTRSPLAQSPAVARRFGALDLGLAPNLKLHNKEQGLVAKFMEGLFILRR